MTCLFMTTIALLMMNKNGDQVADMIQQGLHR